jgi:hypothetical protein
VPVPCFLLFLCFRKVIQEIFSELDETKAEASKKAWFFPTGSSITFRSIGFFLLNRLNLGFLLREKLAAIFIKPFSWGFPTDRSFTSSPPRHL